MSDSDIQQIVPAYQFGKANESVNIAHDEASIEDSHGKSLCAGIATIMLELLPSPRISIRLQGSPKPISFNEAKIVKLSANPQTPVHGFLSSITFSSTIGASLVFIPSSEPIVMRGIENDSMISFVFHLFNFKKMRNGIEMVAIDGDTKFHLERVNLKSHIVVCELQSLPESSARFEELKNIGGYALTHVGRIAMKDGSPFTVGKASELLEFIRFFFSFAKGTWCEPVLPVGFDSAGNRVWELCISPRSHFRSPQSWFDGTEPKQIQDLFSGFFDRWNDEEWRDAFREVVYLYLNANDSLRGLEAGIILTQTAIERLSFQYVIRDRLLLEIGGFKDLRASDRLRLLLSSLNIPIGLTGETPQLQKMAKKFNWIDAPHAITEVRNSLVHPENKRRGQYNSVLYETWNLGLWFLEMSLLRLCGYSGTYGNRLKSDRWMGQSENVPWI